MSYQENFKKREEEIDGVSTWLWPKEDTGAWDGPRDDWITSHREKYLKYVKDRNIVIQAGGNSGMYPRLFAGLFSLVYTFEPDAENFHCLVNNCPLDNVIKINAALGDKHMMMNLNRQSKTNTGMHKMMEDEKTGYIPVLKIDDFDFPTVDLIQLDVEGFEINILHGARNTITKFSPVVITENGHPDYLEFLKECNPKYQEVDRSKADTIYAVKE